jgi:endonuclease G
MKSLLFTLFASVAIIVPSHASAQDQVAPLPVASCASQIPFGMPNDSHLHVVTICRHAYILQSDTVAKIPVWVAYTLTPEHTVGCVKRSNAFATDQSLPDDQAAKKKDYTKSGYDIGHQANDADMDWDPVVERESFILTNMAPQTPQLNRGNWKVLETTVRAWAHSGRTLTLYVGPIWNANDPTIGPDKVVVAHSYYKIIVDDKTKQTLAFVMDNLATDQGDDLAPFQTTVAQIENLTGVTFNVPDSKTVKNGIWPVDIQKEEADKKAACSKPK